MSVCGFLGPILLALIQIFFREEISKEFGSIVIGFKHVNLKPEYYKN
jgi:hypothetical protein